jgi:hypothetical protein
MKKILMTFLMSIVAFMAISSTCSIGVGVTQTNYTIPCDTLYVYGTLRYTDAVVTITDKIIYIEPGGELLLERNGSIEIILINSDIIINGSLQLINNPGFGCNKTVIIGNYTIECDELSSISGSLHVYVFGFGLPVELISFGAKSKQSFIQLDWITATEINNEGFEIQRSVDGENFTSIGWVYGNGSTTEIIEYKFKDNEPMQGINYYRLKQIDFDGQYEYSNIVSATINSDKSKFEIYDLMGRKIDSINSTGIYIKKYVDGTLEFIMK